tara:strand:+ start:3376 stop:4848 length:1473 start_codon:yes stop_codon:yes gene_type:complete
MLLFAAICSLMLFACSSGDIDRANPSEESDALVEIESSSEDSSASASESAENDAGDIDPSTNSDDGLADGSESIKIDDGENDTNSSFSNCSEDDWECSLAAEFRTDNINRLIETLPLINSQMFAECFVDTLTTETGLGFSALYSLVAFIIDNGASADNLGLQDYLSVEAALAACDGFVSSNDIQRVNEIIVVPEAKEEVSRVLVGDVEAGIYYYYENLDPEWGEPYSETIGRGPIKVVMGDVFSYETTETHGHRVKDTFLTFAQNDNFTLFAYDGNSGTSFEMVHTDETVIISASAHLGMNPFEITNDDYAEVDNLKATNALYLSSLENAGIDGDPEYGVYPYPHAGNAYVIENDSDAIEQTIFVAWYWDLSEIRDEASSVSTRNGSVDLHEGFVQRNLADIIFVQIPFDYDHADTSHATPIAAARAVDVLAKNPNASAKELKQLLLAETISVDITVDDSYYDEAVGGITDDSAYISYSEIMTVNILPSR